MELHTVFINYTSDENIFRAAQLYFQFKKLKNYKYFCIEY